MRMKENSERLEWLQIHVDLQTEEKALQEKITFNSLTNSVGPRRFLHCGLLKKTKSEKELVGFLFNDFLLLTTSSKSFEGSQFSFDKHHNCNLKLYRQPLFLNTIAVKTLNNCNNLWIFLGWSKPEKRWRRGGFLAEARSRIRSWSGCSQRQRSDALDKQAGRGLLQFWGDREKVSHQAKVRQVSFLPRIDNQTVFYNSWLYQTGNLLCKVNPHILILSWGDRNKRIKREVAVDNSKRRTYQGWWW